MMEEESSHREMLTPWVSSQLETQVSTRVSMRTHLASARIICGKAAITG